MSSLLDRFCRYVRVETQADEAAATYPSSPGQLVLGKILTDELRALGLRDAEQDAHGIVMATVPATVARPAPTIAWIAHVDTSPETSGKGVRPQVLANYAGGDIVLPGNPAQVIRVADNPELTALKGKTIVTTDGTTLLGADDKSGVAVIMEAAAQLLARPEVPHGPIRILRTIRASASAISPFRLSFVVSTMFHPGCSFSSCTPRSLILSATMTFMSPVVSRGFSRAM